MLGGQLAVSHAAAARGNFDWCWARASRSLIAALLLGLMPVPPALAEKRVALVIGNSAYKHAPRLPNPANDVTAMAVLLKTAGFDTVQVRQDLGASEMRRAIRDFTDLTRDADMAVMFYAGHGIEVDGRNYLVPVDATLGRDIDVEDETVSLERVLQVIEPAKRLRLVILDACRDNPFKGMRRTLATRSVGRGLARVEPVTSDMMIAFAAKAGSVAADGGEMHSPFTSALIKHLATPGLDLRIAFGRVRDEVMLSTNNSQEPFVYGSLGGTTVALLPAAGDDTPPATGMGSPPPSPDPESRDYALAAQIGTREAWDSFLAKYPVGFYAEPARENLRRLAAVDSRQPAILPNESVPKPTSKPNERPVPPVTRTSKVHGAPKAKGETNLECCLRVSRDIKQSPASLMRACRTGIRSFNYCD